MVSFMVDDSRTLRLYAKAKLAKLLDGQQHLSLDEIHSQVRDDVLPRAELSRFRLLAGHGQLRMGWLPMSSRGLLTQAETGLMVPNPDGQWKVAGPVTTTATPAPAR